MYFKKNKKIILIDTAGIKSKEKLSSSLDLKVYSQIITAIKYSHIAILVIDSVKAFQRQDMVIAKLIVNEGRGIVIASNKWDLLPDQYKARARKLMKKQLERNMGEIKSSKIIEISALKGYMTDKLVEIVLSTYNNWNFRAATSILNKWLFAYNRSHIMPHLNGKHLKIKYIMQIKSRPPTFFLSVNNKKYITPLFEKHLRNSLIQEFDLKGIPVRLIFKDYMSDEDKLNFRGQRIIKKIKIFRRKMMRPTYRKRKAGFEYLHGRLKRPDYKK